MIIILFAIYLELLSQKNSRLGLNYRYILHKLNISSNANITDSDEESETKDVSSEEIEGPILNSYGGKLDYSNNDSKQISSGTCVKGELLDIQLSSCDYVIKYFNIELW